MLFNVFTLFVSNISQVNFALTRACDVEWNDAAFDALVLGQKQKELFHSLVRQHAKKETSFIKDNLVGLLAGTPGCRQEKRSVSNLNLHLSEVVRNM